MFDYLLLINFEIMAHILQIMENVIAEVRDFLKSNPSEATLTDFINHFEPKSLKPTGKLHQIRLETLQQMTVVSAHLMVQDIRDPYYYISLAISKKFNKESPFYLCKYGHTFENDPAIMHSINENKSYHYNNRQFLHIMTDRFPVICTPVRYQTKWADQLEGSQTLPPQITLEVDGRAEFRLGEIINVIAIYDPELKKLFMVRPMTAEEVQEEGLEVVSSLAKKQVHHEEARQELMNLLCSYASENFAEHLLATMISEQPLFLGCEANISKLISEIFPRVAHIKLVYPLEQSLFPYKNEEGELQLAPMQMSALRTFVILDLSQFSQKQQVKMTEGGLLNLKALNFFVQEGKTIYRWEINQSQVDHKHIGLIVKGSQLIVPHFNPKRQQISPDFSTISKFPQTCKERIRIYLQSVMKIDPKLEDEERKLIEKDLAEEKNKKLIGINLENLMKFSKLLARSYGRSNITFQDYQRSKELIIENQTSK